MTTMFLIEELWTDTMENHPSDAKGYKPVGWVETESEARRICIAAGIAPPNGWPLYKHMPRKKFHELPRLTAPGSSESTTDEPFRDKTTTTGS